MIKQNKKMKKTRSLLTHPCGENHFKFFISVFSCKITNSIFGETHGLSNQKTKTYFPDINYI